MPVVGSFDPEDLAGLQSKIDETESVGEICELVKTHLAKGGTALTWAKATTSEKYVSLTSKCIVFLITGECSAGSPSSEEDGGETKWISISGEWKGHMVENESRLQLQPDAAVVIIDLN